MYSYAEIDSLIYLLQELQDRVSLEVPAAFIKEESIRESTDQQVAKYSVVYYRTANNEPDGETLEVQSIVDRLARDVLGNYGMEVDVVETQRSRSTHQTIVTIWQPPQQERTATTSLEPFVTLPITLYVGQDVYNLVTDGKAFQILLNGDVLVHDAPSPAYAVGALLAVLQTALPDVEVTNNLPPSPPTDFLAGIAMSVVATPNLSDEAKEHFVQFYEMVTLQDFDSQELDEETP